MKKITLLLIILSFQIDSKELSFDCEGVWKSSSTGKSEILKNKLDFDLENMTGTIENEYGTVFNFYKVELTPKHLIAFTYESWDTKPFRMVFIDRTSLDSEVNGGIGKCKLVERKDNRQF